MRSGRETTLKALPKSPGRTIPSRLLTLFFCALGCGSSASVGPATVESAGLGHLAVPADAYQQFDRAFRAMADHDAADDWSDAHCNEVAGAFVAAWKADNTMR